MPLARQQGPFAVGAIDLEVPVREPRSFATDIVDPSRINRPSSKSRKSRTTAGGSSKRASSSPERGQHGDSRSASDDAPNEGNDGLPQWSPLAHGSKTSTLHLSTVLFTVYYPCAGDGKDLDDNYRRTAWLGRPKRKGVKALFSYLSQYGIAGPFAAVPASPAVATLLAAKMCVWAGPALADPQDPRARAPPPQNRPTVGLFGHEPASFPVIVFSHGLAGSRLAYSQYCSELASQGIVVAAIEHRDGSGIASVVRPPIYPQLARKDQSAENAQQSKHSSKPWKRGHPKAAVPYFTFEAVGLRSFPTDPSEREVGMRQAQLAMRCAEIEECLHVLKRIAEGDGAAVAKESTRSLTSKLGGRPHTRKGLPGSLLEDESNLKCWAGKIDVDYPALAGHSFGGATALELLRGPDPPFPFAMILDPWVEPLIIDDSEPRPLRAPVYVMNSESFTLWGSHFDKVKRLAGDAQHANRENRGWLMTLAGSEHLSFSDYPLLLPRIFRTTISPRSAIEIYTRATLVQVGLLRQRYRERADQPGIKFGDSRALEKEQSKDETLGVRQEGKGATGNERTMSPEPICNDGTQDATPPPAGEEGEDGVNESSWQRFARGERTHAETEMEQAVESGQDPIRAVADDGEDKSVHPTREAGDDHPAAKARRQGEAVAHHSSTHEHLKGVVAFRTDSGGMASRPRRTDDYKDLVKDPARIEDEELKHDLDHDVEVVHASLKDLSESQKHKKYRTRSLAGLMYRSMGLRPSLSTPGAVLIHDLRRQEGKANEEGNEGDSGASTMI